MRTEKRNRGVVLTRLDFAPVMESAFQRFMDTASEDVKAEGWSGFESLQGHYALGQAPDGKWYVVGTEGVGWEVSEAKNFGVECYLQSADGTRFGMFPSATAWVTLAEVLASRTEETIDLADLVRSFGDRLEANFSIWWDTLGGKGRAHDVS